jgi:predicted metal-dependent HD superfamily phosphohydrolase
MTTPLFEESWAYALRRLERELSPNLLYHGVAHTRDDVVPTVKRLAEMEGIGGEDLSMLLTSAWFHDLGYIVQPQYHELISVRIASEILPEFEFDHQKIETVKWAILATALPQKPQNHLEAILTDADLDVLGREDYPITSDNLRREHALYGAKYTDREWYARQLAFLEAHTYFTPSAKESRDGGKSKNIEYVKRILEKLN